LILSLLGTLGGGGATAAPEWQRIRSANFLFSASLPGQPEIKRHHSSSFVGNTRSTMVESRLRDTYVAVVVTRLPRAAAWLAPRQFLFRQARRRLIEANDFLDRGVASTTRSNIVGQLFHFATRTGGTEPPRRGRAELYVMRGHLILAIGSQSAGSSTALVDRFFASLDLNVEDCRHQESAGRCKVDLVLAE